MQTVNIGLFGFGVVGEGIYHVLQQKPQLGVRIQRIVIKHPEKIRNAPSVLFSTDANTILQDADIALVVELIDDAEAAFDIALRALRSGKSVISANKKMIAAHLPVLVETARTHQVSFLYEAAVCGSVPVIRNLEEYFDNDLITHITGIVNGSTNFILTHMHKKSIPYSTALQQAQENGYAESNPALDVEGWDAANKIRIACVHAFGAYVDAKCILVKGITSISDFDIQYAKEKGYVIKLIATCSVDADGVLTEISVLPTFIPRYHPLRLTNDAFNGILIGGQLTDEQFLYGKGAGRYPTASAVLSDISAYTYQYRYAYKKGIQRVHEVRDVEATCYIRFQPQSAPDFSQIGEVHEYYRTAKAHVVIVTGSLQAIVSACAGNHISLIRFPEPVAAQWKTSESLQEEAVYVS